MKTLEQIIQTPVTFGQMKKFVPEAKVMLYDEFSKLKDIPPVAVYLFQTSYNYGHWCCVLRNGKDVDFFDSYGIPIEGEHAFVSQELLQHLGESKNLIKDLCIKKGYSMSHNTTTLQGEKSQTCGRHVVERIRKKMLDNESYAHWIKNTSKEARVTPDILVSYLVS
jgi:hypothetical protein